MKKQCDDERKMASRVLMKISIDSFWLIAGQGFYTVVGDNINIMKTTFELNFDFYHAFKQHGYTKIWKQREAVNLKSFTLITCKLVIRKKLVNN